MGISVTGQTMVFLTACVLGAALGLLYDLFRLTRLIFPCGRAAVFLQDVLFFLLCAGATFLFLLKANSGEVRLFVLLGEGLGATVYYFTVGWLFIHAARAVLRAIRRFLRFLLGLAAPPAHRAARAGHGLVKKTGILLKNRTVWTKSHLHLMKSMVYNLRKPNKNTVRKRRGARRPGKRHEKKKKR